MDRLTKRINGYAHGIEGVSADRLTRDYCRGQFEATACVEKLAEYEDLEEQGKLLKLPCVPGQSVWKIKSGKIVEWIVGTIKIEASGISFYDVIYICDISDFGKTVFLTREEAEAVSKELMDKGE